MRPFSIRKPGEELATIVLAIDGAGKLLIADEAKRLVWVRTEAYELAEAYFTADEATFSSRFAARAG